MMPMKAGLLFLALVLAYMCAFAAGECITQTLGSTWRQDGKDRSQWNAAITAGSEAVRSLQLTISNGALVQVWELELQSNGQYGLPQYRLQAGGLAAGQSHQFGYIWESATKATIGVSSVTCSSPSTAPSTAASASPAAPSASAAPASPSASPSSQPSIVASPQPSTPAGCSVTLTQTARAGGSWTDANFRYQTYDLVVSNKGNRPATVVQFTLGLTGGQEVSQFWNIERQGASANVFNVAAFYFPLAAGANAEAGYILKSPLSASTAAPSLTVNQVSCAAASSSPAAPSPSSAVPPSPSAAPASPSAMPSANPTIVASPQPSSAPVGCSVKATIVARPASAGGVWQDSGNTYQIFDITITNNGQRPVNGGLITFALSGSSPAITQFWELSRQGSTNAFNISFNYGALQVGASQGAGIIVRVAGSSPAAAPGLTISQLACQ